MKKIILVIFVFISLGLTNSAIAEELSNISFDDFMLDKNSLIGKTIKIKCYCRNTINDKFTIYKSGESSDAWSSMSLDTSNLSREVRKWLMQNCKNGKFITLKAVVKKYDLNVIEIDEAKNIQVNSSSKDNKNLNSEIMSFDDFMLDKNSLIGKTIKIKCYCRNTINDKFSIYKSGESSDAWSSMSLDTSNLSREVRKWLMQNCKNGKFITLKAVVKKYDLNVIEIDEAKNTQVNSSSKDNKNLNSEIMSFDDFMLDKNSLIGKTIKIKCYCRNTINDKFTIYKSGESSDAWCSMSLDTSNLSREVKKWLMQNCKEGKFITLKAVVKKYDLNVLEIEEAK